MHLIDATNAEAYLRDAGRIAPEDRVKVRELAGGVSNIVLLVEFADPARESFVLKQAREQLRVAQPWFCSPERIWREVEVLKAYASLLDSAPPELRVPKLLFEDRGEFLFAMTAAPADATTLKSILMAGSDGFVEATRCGALLGTLHGNSWQDAQLAERFACRRYFHDLRVDPYYGEIARRHLGIAPQVDDLIATMGRRRHVLVHGDFSPKNVLVTPDSVTLIDFEVGHFGDPAFDIAFFLTHLQLKAIHLPARATPFWACSEYFLRAYGEALTSRTSDNANAVDFPHIIEHLRACLLARVDGKSPVEYLDETERQAVRELALRWFANPPSTQLEAFRDVFETARETARKRGIFIEGTEHHWLYTDVQPGGR